VLALDVGEALDRERGDIGVDQIVVDPHISTKFA